MDKREVAEMHCAAAGDKYAHSPLIESIKEFEKAIQSNPSSIAAQNALKYALRDKDEIEEEVKHLSSELAASEKKTAEENLQARNTLARFYFELGYDDKAQTEWAWVATHGVGDSQRSAKKQLLKRYGVIVYVAVKDRYAKGRLMEVIEECEKDVQANQDLIDAQEKLKRALREKEEIEEELQHLSSELDTSEEKTTVENLWTRNALANLYFKLSRDDKAIREWAWVAVHGTGNPQHSAKKQLFKRYGVTI